MKRTISLILVAALWASLAAFAWLKPPAASSDAERRPLEQFPELSGESLLSGQFMKDFADYAVDQFPLRDRFRTLNAYLSYYLLGKKDNNGIYLHDGYAAKMEYPMDEKSISYAIARFNELYEMYLTDCNVRFALVPDKGCYLAQEAGALSLDYDALYEQMAQELRWAEFIDLRPHLSIDSFYRTDTHWSQEAILPAAEAIADSLGVTVPEFDRVITLEKPFYGVYYGQAALPMEPDAIHYLTNGVLEGCTVYCHDNGLTSAVAGAHQPRRDRGEGAHRLPGFLRQRHGAPADPGLRKGLGAGYPLCKPRSAGAVCGIRGAGCSVPLQHPDPEQQQRPEKVKILPPEGPSGGCFFL